MDYAEKIDILQENASVYVIDFLPKRATLEEVSQKEFEEIDLWFLEHYLHDFAEKMIKVVLKALCYYPCVIHLTEFAEGYQGKLGEIPVYQNLRGRSIDFLVETIREVITEPTGTSVEFLFLPDSTSEEWGNLSLSYQFMSSFCGDYEEMIGLLGRLVEGEGLFWRAQ